MLPKAPAVLLCRIERAIRLSALGRKTYPFAGVDWTAKTNGHRQTHDLAPEAYLRDVLGRIADRPINHTGQLLRRREKLKR